MTSLELKGLRGLRGLRGLQGLDHLIHEAKNNLFKHQVLEIPLNKLIPGKYQPRTVIKKDSLQDLASSIASEGIIQPLIVRKVDGARECVYEIIAGERRWQAAKLLGLQTVPVIIRAVNDETALAFALIENIQREDLNPIDEASSLDRLKTEFNMTHEEIALRVGRSRSAVSNLLRLLYLHPQVKEWLSENKIDMGHARAILSLSLPSQREVAQQIIDSKLSVRAIERLIQKIKTPVLVKETPDEHDYTHEISEWVKILSSRLSTSVHIQMNSTGKGKLTITITSPTFIKNLIKSKLI